MSISLLTTTANVMAFQEPFVISASSSLTGGIGTSYFKFRYVITIDINGTERAKIKLKPNAGQDAHFDLSSIIKDYFENLYDDSGTVIHKILAAADGEGRAVFVELKVYEEYATTANGAVAEYTSVPPAAVDSFIVLSTTSQLSDGVQPVIAGTYEYNGTIPVSFMSKGPTYRFTRAGEYQTIPILASSFLSATVGLQVVFSFYDSTNTLISTKTVSAATIGLSSFVLTKSTVNANKIYQFLPVGYQNLEDQVFDVDVKPSTKSDLNFYTIKVEDTTVNYETDLYTFYIAETTRYEAIQVAFVDSMGSWDYFTFDLVSTKALNISRESFQKPIGNWAAGADFTFSANEKTEKIFSIEGTETLILNSNWVTDEYFIWLRDLIMSRTVMVNLSGTYYHAIINNATYDYKKSVNSKVNNLQIELRLTNRIR